MLTQTKLVKFFLFILFQYRILLTFFTGTTQSYASGGHGCINLVSVIIALCPHIGRHTTRCGLYDIIYTC